MSTGRVLAGSIWSVVMLVGITTARAAPNFRDEVPKFFMRQHAVDRQTNTAIANSNELNNNDSSIPPEVDRKSEVDDEDKKLANINYAGLGYDYILGNPHSDLYDPGFRQAVLQLDYRTGSRTIDGKWLIPDNVQVLQTVSCSYETDSDEVMGSTSYQNSLSVDASVTGELPKVKFSASFGFKEVREGTSTYRRSYVSAVARCSAYRADIDYMYSPFNVTSDFADAVAALPTARDDVAYANFIRAFGTHFASTLYMGAKSVMRSEFESTNWTKMMDDSFSVKTAASASFWVATVGESMSTEVQRRLARTYDDSRRAVKEIYLGGHPPADGKWQTWASSSAETPYPIQYTLNPLTDLMTTKFFPGSGDAVLAVKRRLLNETLAVYCRGIPGCGIPDPDRPPVRMDRGRTMFVGSQLVSCRPGYGLLSCGIDNLDEGKSRDFSRYAVPSDPNSCECYDNRGAICVPWCTNAVKGFEIVNASGTNEFSVLCPTGKKVLGCHMLPFTDKEVIRKHYPTDDGNGCTCYDYFGGVCYASCASNIVNHEIRSQFGVGNTTVSCSPDNYVLGCGVKPVHWQPDEKWRTYNVASQSSCQCHDNSGATCYASCGKFA